MRDVPYLAFQDDAIVIVVGWKNARRAETLFKHLIEEQIGIPISQKDEANAQFGVKFESIGVDTDIKCRLRKEKRTKPKGMLPNVKQRDSKLIEMNLMQKYTALIQFASKRIIDERVK